MSNLSVFNNDFFDELMYSVFGKPEGLIFNAGGTKDMMPSVWSEMKDKNGYKCVCRTVGISPDDVKVTLNGNRIHVSGKTKYEDDEYNTTYDLPLSKDVASNIESIKYKTANGLTHIYVYTSRNDRRIIAERISD